MKLHFHKWIERDNVTAEMNQAASREAVDTAERSLSEQDRLGGSFAFPPSYLQFLTCFDGGFVTYQKSESDHSLGVSFLGTGEHCEAWNSLPHYNAADSVLMNHKIDVYHSIEPLVVFALDEDSNFWAFDPGVYNTDGEMSVVYIDHETGDVCDQAENFTSFFLSIVNGTLEYGDTMETEADGASLINPAVNHPLKSHAPLEHAQFTTTSNKTHLYRLGVHKIGYFGDKTVIRNVEALRNSETGIPDIAQLHIVFNKWSGDPIVGINLTTLVTADLATRMEHLSLTGFRFENVIVSTDAAFRRQAKKNPEVMDLPGYLWMIVVGTAEYGADGKIISHSGHDISIGVNLEPISTQNLISLVQSGRSDEILPTSSLVVTEKYLEVLRDAGMKNAEVHSMGTIN